MRTKTQNAIRPLSGVEVLMACMHDVARGTSQAVQALSIDSDVDINVHIKAAKLLFNEFPILRSCIKENQGQLWFYDNVDFDSIEISKVQYDDEHADTILSDIVDSPLPQEQSLWKLDILQNRDDTCSKIVMTFHHAMLDGHGLSIVGSRYLQYLDGQNSPVPHREFPPPINNYLKVKNPQATKSYTPIFSHLGLTPIEKRRTAWQSFAIDGEFSERLNSKAKSDKLTLNALFGAALIKALDQIDASNTAIEIKSAVSLRIFDDTNDHNGSNLGCYMSIVNSEIDVHDASLLVIAKKYGKSLLVGSQRQCLVKKEFDYNEVTLSIKQGLKSSSFIGGVGITNIGDISIPLHYKTFSLRDYFTTVNRLSGNYAFVVHCYKFNNTDIIQFVYSSPLLSDTFVNKLMELLRNQLLAYCN